MAGQTARNTLIFDVTGASTDVFIMPDTACNFTLSTTATTGFVTMIIDDGKLQSKFIVGTSVIGMVQDLITNSTREDLSVIKKFSKITFVPGGEHPTVGGGTTFLDAATDGKVIFQWVRRGQ